MKELFLYNILFKILSIIITNYLIYKTLSFFVPKERDLYKFKIKYFALNFSICIIYTCLFIIFVLVIRTRVLDKDINLYLVYQNCKNLSSYLDYTNSILLFILISCIMILIIIIFKEINTIFINQLIKRYIYTLFGCQVRSKYVRYIHQICISALYERLFDFIQDISELANKLEYIQNKGSQPYLYLLRFCQFIVTKLPIILIFFYFIHELKYNHGVLSSKFNSWLFIFFLYSLYKHITNYISFGLPTINNMVFNMYYRDRSIKYANMPKHWQAAVYSYVDEGLSFYTSSKYEAFNDNINICFFINDMIDKYTWKSIDGYNYINGIGEDFQEENNKSLDIVHYPYWKDENFNKNINNTLNKAGGK